MANYTDRPNQTADEQINCDKVNALIEFYEIKVAFGNADVFLLQTVNWIQWPFNTIFHQFAGLAD